MSKGRCSCPHRFPQSCKFKKKTKVRYNTMQDGTQLKEAASFNDKQCNLPPLSYLIIHPRCN